MLVRTLARICDDPYDPVFSAPVPPVPGRRVADLGDFGFIEFIADEAEQTGPRLLPRVDWLAITSPPSPIPLTARNLQRQCASADAPKALTDRGPRFDTSAW